jgi:hypothetical protein
MFTSLVYLYPVTYASNNNVNDATCLEGCVSPEVDSDMLKQMATIRDLEEAKAHFPTPEPG